VQGGRTPAIALYSGTLASTLAARLAERAGLPLVRLVYFRSPFFLEEDRVGLQAERWLPGHRFQSITLKKTFLTLCLLYTSPSPRDS